ncbi:hypothetical protein B9Z55_017933 [Caenorhabditis nigoni]|nr:hypothetical protein B9Z55_017933 [Caenorhabditis nigoni]
MKFAFCCLVFFGCVSAEFREEGQVKIVQAHNELRSAVAKGGYNYHKFVNPPLPQAANMRKLKWNVILARQAHETANKCGYEPFFQPNFGENVYAPSSSNPFKNLDDIGASAMAEWVDDVSWYTWKSLKINENPAKLRRFSQMIRDETSLVGCGLKDCGKTNGYYKYVVVCKYDPP